MSLVNPGIVDTLKANKGKIAIVAGVLVLIGLSLWGYQGVQNWRFNSKQEKLQGNINAALQDAANVKQQAANLDVKRVEAQANVNAAVKEYQNAVFGLDDAKRETNQALANYQKAVNANGNINATADDVLKAIDKLNQ